MITYTEKKHALTVQYGLTYFDEPYQKPKADIIREWQYSRKQKFSQEFYTLFIDLTTDAETIFSGFEKITKYQINKAKRDNIKIATLDGAKEKNDFYTFYDTFAATKNLPPIGQKEVDLLIENNMFKIRVAFYEEEALVYHGYVTANKRARLMQSASLFRDSSDSAFKNLTGRANRLLHWDDICYFKQNGFTVYDLGGVSMDKNNQETQAINRFKECFGGELKKEYKSQIPLTIKGFGFLLAKKLLGKI